MKHFIIFILYVSIFYACTTKEASQIEEAALNYLLENVIDNEPFFNNTQIIINKKLQDFSLNNNLYLYACESCTEPKKLLFTNGKKINIIKDWNHSEYNLPLYGKRNLQNPLRNIFITMHKKILIENDEYIVMIKCYKKSEDDKSYVYTYYLFLNNSGIVINCCFMSLVESGYK
jgi:hypothetical protein